MFGNPEDNGCGSQTEDRQRLAFALPKYWAVEQQLGTAKDNMSYVTPL